MYIYFPWEYGVYTILLIGDGILILEYGVWSMEYAWGMKYPNSRMEYVVMANIVVHLFLTID